MYSLDISKAIHCSRFGRMKQKNGWERSDFRSIEQNLFVFLIDGQADFQVAGHDYSLQTGDVLIIPSNTLYKAYTDDFCEYYFYHFDGQIRQSEQPAYSPLPRRFSFDLPALHDPHIYFSDHTKTAQDFHRLYNSVIACIDYHSRGSRTGQQLLECEFLKIMLMLADIGEQQQNSGLPGLCRSVSVSAPLRWHPVLHRYRFQPGWSSCLEYGFHRRSLLPYGLNLE